jgi:hypothetical protein
MNDKIEEIKKRLNNFLDGRWSYCEGTDNDHWELTVENKEMTDMVWLVQDDSGVPPDRDFIEFILCAAADLRYLISLVETGSKPVEKSEK